MESDDFDFDSTLGPPEPHMPGGPQSGGAHFDLDQLSDEEVLDWARRNPNRALALAPQLGRVLGGGR